MKRFIKNYTLLFLIILLLLILISFTLGKYPISLKELLSIIMSKFFTIQKTWSSQMETVFFNVRLPRILLTVMVGGCLSVSGASFQGIFRNPLVSPDILGAEQGAAFGASLGILLSWSSARISIMAFVFSLFSVVVALMVSKRAKGGKLIGLVLAGIIVGSLFNSATSYLKLKADPTDQLPEIIYWLMGSFSGAKMSDVTFAVIPMLIGLIPLFLFRWKINILTMGDDEAKTMGVDANRTRLLIVAASTLITATSISVSGMIGWVGLVIPHFARFLTGCDYRKLMPVTFLMGSSFLLLVDNFSRMLSTSEIPIGILTSFVGAPFFLYLITKEGGNVEH